MRNPWAVVCWLPLLSMVSISALGCDSGSSSGDDDDDAVDVAHDAAPAHDAVPSHDPAAPHDAATPHDAAIPHDAATRHPRQPARRTQADSGSSSPCADATLKWKTARKTSYTSYPDPGSEECVKYNGCMWAGQFAACDGKKTEDWVAAHNIVAAFPDFATLELHDLCLRSGSKTLVVTVYDTCADSDCDGCCTENQGTADQLIDIESYTAARWGVGDGAIEWADLGPTKTAGCD